VTPADRSGVVVKFGIKRIADAALVAFSTPDGKAIAPGSRGRLNADGETFVVGYDGQAYIKGLKALNHIAIEGVGRGTCNASFSYVPKPGSQVVIRGVVCQ
jgi:outer membrane usher protein